ncbi:MAG: hypothetical protein GY698_04785 [Actinomycetia bacterium]|nr:hypothetical protein [Actinomycetes bacterium]
MRVVRRTMAAFMACVMVAAVVVVSPGSEAQAEEPWVLVGSHGGAGQSGETGSNVSTPPGCEVRATVTSTASPGSIPANVSIIVRSEAGNQISKNSYTSHIGQTITNSYTYTTPSRIGELAVDIFLASATYEATLEVRNCDVPLGEYGGVIAGDDPLSYFKLDGLGPSINVTALGTLTTSGGEQPAGSLVNGTADGATAVADGSTLVIESGAEPGTFLRDEFSVEFWFDPTAANFPITVATQAGGLTGWILGYSPTAAETQFRVFSATGVDTVASGGQFGDGLAHVVATKSATELCVYVNGAAAGCTPWSAGPVFYSPADDRIEIVAGADLIIDELAFYDRALSAAEVLGHYDAGKPVAPDPCAGLSLAECFAPELRFHPDEAYFPMDPHVFVSGSELWWASDSLCADKLIAGYPTPVGLATLRYQAFERTSSSLKFWSDCNPIEDRPYSTDEYTRPFSAEPGNRAERRARRVDAATPLATNEGFYLKWNGVVTGDWNDWVINTALNGVVSGGEVVAPVFASELPAPTDVPGGRMLAYQFFYGYDPKASVDAAFSHEGDWERVDVVLDSQDEPVRVQYHGHGCDATNVDWADVGRVGETHPVVYVAEGAHASYPTPRESGTPLCDGVKGLFDVAEYVEGVSVVWRTWGGVVDPASQCWYQFGGAWGATAGGLFRSDRTGPAGPPWKITGRPLTGPGTDCSLWDGTPPPPPDPAVEVQVLIDSPSSWFDHFPLIVTAPSGTVFTVFFASVPIPLASGTTGPDGVASLDLEVPDGTPPGMHRLIVLDSNTGEEYLVREVFIEAPPECLADPASGDPDIDGDFVTDGCDPNPLDGPLADADGDLVANGIDNCVLVPNRDQTTIGTYSQGAACNQRAGFNPAPTIVPPDQYPVGPTAADDTTTVLAGDTATVDVIGNDTPGDAGLEGATLEIVTGPTAGIAGVVDDGNGAEISYTAPAAGDIEDTISYVVCAADGRCATATLTVTVLDPGSCTITGTPGDDVLSGTAGDDVICGLDGDDVIDGLEGNDLILGGPGADTISGGPGDDEIIGGRGHDDLRGNTGNDLIRGRRGNDTLRGGAGTDQLHGGRGDDDIQGGDGPDHLWAGKGSDQLHGNAGSDTLHGRMGPDTLRGGRGQDHLYGGRGPDTLIGGDGHDELWGRRGADQLDGGAGQDTGHGGPGADTCTNIETATSCQT